MAQLHLTHQLRGKCISVVHHISLAHPLVLCFHLAFRQELKESLVTDIFIVKLCAQRYLQAQQIPGEARKYLLEMPIGGNISSNFPHIRFTSNIFDRLNFYKRGRETVESRFFVFNPCPEMTFQCNIVPLDCCYRKNPFCFNTTSSPPCFHFHTTQLPLVCMQSIYYNELRIFVGCLERDMGKTS